MTIHTYTHARMHTQTHTTHMYMHTHAHVTHGETHTQRERDTRTHDTSSFQSMIGKGLIKGCG